MFNSSKNKKMRMYSDVAETLTTSTYNLILGMTILYGFVINAILVAVAGDFFMAMNPILFLIIYFVSGIGGSVIANNSNNPAVSFLGYNMLVVPMGGLLSICLPYYQGADILSALVVTGIAVGLMIIVSTIFPDFFRGLGRTLFFSLLIGLIGEIIAMLLGYGGNFFNWVFVIIFTLYIGYDWCRAQEYPKTVDNAIDSALDIYLDIINLFIRILEIMSKKDD